MEELTQQLEHPSILAQSARFLVKLAENEEEMNQAFELRYRIFKLEQHRMNSLDGSCGNIDRDAFDSRFMHLLVIDRKDDRVVGTYRMQSGKNARENDGFYSETEYRIENIDQYANRVFEVGRSCVDPEFRRGAVVAMLWAGIAEVHHRFHFDYMLGCVSLEHTDNRIGWSLYDYLRRNSLLTENLHAVPLPEYELPRFDGPLMSDDEVLSSLPPLFKGYLRIGAKIGGEPALDRGFGSIDFLVWFDFETLPDKYIRHFKV